MCLDKGYDYDEVRALGIAFGFTMHIRCRGEEAKVLKKTASVRARRWVVERTHSWTNRFPPYPHPLGKARGRLLCHAAPGVRHHHLASLRPARIGHLPLSLASSAAWRFNSSELGVLGGLAVQSSLDTRPALTLPGRLGVLRGLAVRPSGSTASTAALALGHA
jgi:hypothetical protein